MRSFIRFFFRTLRVLLGPVMLLKEKLSQPPGITRPAAAQAQVDQECQSLALYQFKTCPFCIKVRQEMRRLSLNIRRIDAQHPGPDRQALQEQGGYAKVPCLKVTDSAGNSQWLYESDKIMAYLQGRFAAA